MTSLFYLMISVSLLSVLAESVVVKKKELQARYSKLNSTVDKKKGSSFLVFAVTVILSLFSGLRTEHNDTYAYIRGFINNIPSSLPGLSEISFSLGDHPGFFIFQVLIKQYISTDPQVFLFLSAFIVNGLFVFFYYKYSPKFSLTIFLYVTSGLFVFGMAAMKQIFAMSIGLWALHYALKKKWVTFALLLLLASSFHPYIIFFGLAPLLKDKIWSWRELLILLVATIGGLYFDTFIALIAGMHSMVVDDIGYELLMGSGVNIFRVMVYAVAPILSLVFLKKLRSIQDQMLTLSVNFSIIGFAFMLLAFWGDPVYLGRMAIYFNPLSILALTYIIMNCFPKGQRLTIIFLCVVFYGAYFYYQYGIAMPFIYRSILGTYF